MKNKNLFKILFFFLGLSCSLSVATEINVMAPLLIGNPHNPSDPTHESEWQDFRRQLQILKNAGVRAISTDVWWGLVEGEEAGRYDWRFYDRLAAEIITANLRWVPILSFHQLGGNVGDSGYMPLPKWLEQRYSADDLWVKSEQGHISKESVSVWATDLVGFHLQSFMREFETHFNRYVTQIDEINVSLGPAGELRYPSYNGHDQNSGYPTRGSLQAYSPLAVRSWQNFVREKYHSIDTVNHAWGFNLNDFTQIYPPHPELLKDAFWRKQEQFSPYGKDFFDWYNSSLVRHGKKVLHWAAEAFPHLSIGAKIPGVHWRVGSDRAAELAAGLIRTSYSDWYSAASAFGYAGTLEAFAKTEKLNKITLHFTALEMDDGREIETNRPKSLVHWLGQAARERNLIIKGENALSGELSNDRAWDNMFEALKWHGYTGLTLLRANEIAYDEVRMRHLRYLVDRLK